MGTKHIYSYGGSVDTASKGVTYNEEYGTLPTPTREGYTFKGWNGKNYVNISDRNIKFTNSYYAIQSPTIGYILKPNTTYTLSFDYVVNSSSYPVYTSIGCGKTGYSYDLYYGSESTSYSGTGKNVVKFTTPSSFPSTCDPAYVRFRLARMSSSGSVDVDVSNIQLEEGTTATEYEPYYVTSDTNVTQNRIIH